MIGARLLALREDADLSQSQLGEILNISKHAISSYEREKSEPPDATKIAIAKYFNVSVDYLLGLTDIPALSDQQYPIIRLPKNFPKAKIPELKRYAKFLMSED
ncbi:MAG: helix-turn-helix transcriptional regulator [Clostridia bacterium]|nr:helix-turn-helix transcriptional regulator [Clostridia bacterium]